MTKTETVVDDERAEVTITREFDAPRDLIFAAFTDPAQLARFWGPTGTHAPVEHIVIELHAGGRFETVMVADDGSWQAPTKAEFLEVVAPERLSWREFESGMVTTSTFTDLGDGRTRIVIHETDVPAAFRSEEALAGFVTSLDRMEQYLATLVA